MGFASNQKWPTKIFSHKSRTVRQEMKALPSSSYSSFFGLKFFSWILDGVFLTSLTRPNNVYHVFMWLGLGIELLGAYCRGVIAAGRPPYDLRLKPKINYDEYATDISFGWNFLHFFEGIKNCNTSSSSASNYELSGLSILLEIFTQKSAWVENKL